jgi:AcrR family transcriptional regulator
MARWAPDARGSLQAAALDLFDDSSFDEVTVQQIAEHAGVTERTFFRYFATKEDVLFADGDSILQVIVAAVHATPKSMSAIAVLERVCAALDESFRVDRPHHRKRLNIILSEPALTERDLMKQVAWVDAIAQLLVARGLPKARSVVLVNAAVSVFRDVYQQWATDRSRTSLIDRWNHAIAQLQADLHDRVPK